MSSPDGSAALGYAGSQAIGGRVLAAKALADIRQQRGNLRTWWEKAKGEADGKAWSAGRKLAFTAARLWPRLDAIAVHVQKKPFADPKLEALVRVALGELEGASKVAAAVWAWAQSAGQLGGSWAISPVNAILRTYLRRRGHLEAALAGDDAFNWSLPPWLAAAWRRQLPAFWRQIAASSTRAPPMTLRLRGELGGEAKGRGAGGGGPGSGTLTTQYLKLLEARGIAAEACAGGAINLKDPVRADLLPGFAEGKVAIQDSAATFAVEVLAPGPGEKILDACAAPGGKAALMMDLCPRAELTLLDKSAARLARLRENLRRLQLKPAEILRADAARPEKWWDKVPFTKILVDAPCSGTGILRRAPDIKVLLEKSEPERLGRYQRDLLTALWGCLAKGGKMIYSTCSLLADENQKVVAAFLEQNPSAVLEPIDPIGAAGGWRRLDTSYGLLLIPGEHSDGAFVAAIGKPS